MSEPTPSSEQSASPAPAPAQIAEPPHVVPLQTDSLAPKKSRYASFAENTTMRSVVWALVITLVLVAVVGMLFFGVGNDPDREVPENSRVDVAASAERAQEIAPFTVSVPALGDGWIASNARYADGSDPRWTVRYSSPSGALVTLTQAGEITPALLQDTIPGARSDGTVAVGDVTCDVYTGGEETDVRALACPADASGLIITGKTAQAELMDVAEPALESARS